MSTAIDEGRFRVDPDDAGSEVTSVLHRPSGADRLLVLAHGAGAGVRHTFMEAATTALAARGVATFRFQFPYMEKGSRRPDARAKLLASVRAAVAAAHAAAPELALFAGGKSMGGRMTSQAAAEAPLPGVKGIAFFGFPLHPAGRPEKAAERAAHLARVRHPMLFMQGTRDKLAALELLEPVCAQLGKAATLHRVDGADHSFHVLKRSGRTDDQVLAELADVFVGWAQEIE